jgi:hypothetical protein
LNSILPHLFNAAGTIKITYTRCIAPIDKLLLLIGSKYIIHSPDQAGLHGGCSGAKIQSISWIRSMAETLGSGGVHAGWGEEVSCMRFKLCCGEYRIGDKLQIKHWQTTRSGEI